MSLQYAPMYPSSTAPAPARDEDSNWVPFLKLLMFVTAAFLSWGAIILPLLSLAAI